MSIKFEKQWGPARLRKWMQSVEKIIIAYRPITGTGATVDETPNGCPINALPGSFFDSGDGGGGGGGTPIFEAGTVTSLEPDADPTFEVVFEDGVYKINIGIPRGEKGDQGELGPEGAPGRDGTNGVGIKGDPGPSPSSATATCGDDDELDITLHYAE